jgi:hypothetical protein
MSRGKWPLAAGVVLAAVYVLAAVTTPPVGPLDGRPIFDGILPPPPYRWVDPPPNLEDTNVPPEGVSASLPFRREKSQAQVVTTPDLQATFFFVQGAFPPEPGQDSVAASIDPLAPSELQSPAAWAIQGNVYRVTARYQPGGEPIEQLQQEAELTFLYPVTDGAAGEPTVVRSTDGEGWQPLGTTVIPAQHVTQSRSDALGYFAVALPQEPREPNPSRNLLPIAVIGAGIVLVGAVAWLWLRRRRSPSSTSKQPTDARQRRSRGRGTSR